MVCGWSKRDLDNAFGMINIKKLLASCGACSLAWRSLYRCHSDRVIAFFNNVACDFESMHHANVLARCDGKNTSPPTPREIRAILPLPPVAAVLDALVCMGLEHLLLRSFAVPAMVYEGAISGTQTMDIAHASRLFMERGMDSHSSDVATSYTIAQFDIGKFYDHINPIAVCRQMEQLSDGPWLVGAAACLQMGPTVQLSFGRSLTKSLPARAIGSLTGSRVAGVLGRWIVRDCISKACWDQSYTQC